MTVEEIFNKISSHMLEGVMFHADMVKAYDFLGLWGFARCHESHCLEEMQGYCYWSHYFASHYFKLIHNTNDNIPKLVPDGWHKYTTMEVDINTKRTAVKDFMTKWVEWEKETKQLYQDMRQELTNINEVDAAMQLDHYICDVSKELCHAQKKFLKLETLGYDINTIITISEGMDKKYKEKLGW